LAEGYRRGGDWRRSISCSCSHQRDNNRNNIRLFEILTVPFLEPFPAGANVTLIVHFGPAEMGDGDRQSSVSEKSPVVRIASIRREFLVAFVTVSAVVCSRANDLDSEVRLATDEIRAGGSTVTGILT